MAVRASLRFAAASDMGRRRTNNEDRYYIDPERGIFAVIDGVGGQAAGERAADTAVEVSARTSRAPDRQSRRAPARSHCACQQ